jgi:hypothetical protein
MKATQNNWNLKVGNSIVITYNGGNIRTMNVTRVEEKSWYDERNCRNSFGTLNRMMSKSGDIIDIKIV